MVFHEMSNSNRRHIRHRIFEYEYDAAKSDTARLS
jgi:hypothetical protein